MGQSAEFGQFLRVMRARMRPEAAGLPTTTTLRRVPGLRREEIAQLAGVSTDYYTRLEQGRQIRPSQAVVDAVARALQLDVTERAHMLDLLHNCPSSSKSPSPVQRVRPGLWQLLDAIGDTPALVLGRRTDVLSSNRMANLLFTDFSHLPAGERNLTRWIILEPGAQDLFPDWKTVAAEAVGALRVDVGRHPNDPQTNQLVGELAVTSEHFRKWWAGHHVTMRSFGTVRLHNPTVGDLALDFETLALPDDADQTLRIYSAKPGSASQDALRLLSSWAHSESESGNPLSGGVNVDASPTGSKTSTTPSNNQPTY
jgi:transcriptional regulator with XRE-family HTH domain